MRFALPSMVFVATILGSASSAWSADKAYFVHERRFGDLSEVVARMAVAREVVVGEKHDTAKIQAMEATLFSAFADQRPVAQDARPARVTLAWEFLDWSDRARIDAAYSALVADPARTDDFLRAIFAASSDGSVPEPTYAPLLAAAAARGAELLPTNLSRAEKAPVVKGGLAALDPALLPPGFALGSAAYRERFAVAMGGHVGDEALENYFAAQCLVDDAVAYHVTEHRAASASDPTSKQDAFLVIGDFHTSYFDGVVARLRARDPSTPRLVVHVSDEADGTEAEWLEAMVNPRYGDIADIVVFPE